jgi:hypothetical protein
MNCCHRHAHTLPSGCEQGRLCPERMHRISEVDAPGYLPREQAKDAEAEDRAKAPSMFDVLLANGLWVALIVVIVYLASLYAGWVPTWSGWPALVAFAAF